MAVSTGARVQLAYVAESVFGTTPATPQMILLPKSSMTLDLTKELIEDPTITGDRMGTASRHGNYQVGGDIVATLRHGQFDDLFEAAMGGTWASNVVKTGSTNRSFTVEQGFLDVAQYRRFTGVRVDGFELTVEPGQIVTSTFSVLGSGMTTSSSALDATPTALQDKDGMSHVGGSISIAGSPVTCTAATLSVRNGMEAAYAIGSSQAFDVVWADATVTGSVTFYFEDLTEYNLFLNETVASLAIAVTDGTNTLTFTVPAARFNSGNLPVPGQGMLFLTVDFVGERDATSNTKVQITRSA